MKRHFVTIGERQLHYRREGSGPPILLLHRIPRTSASLVDMIACSATFGTVIAPDLPDYGGSDALEQPTSLDGYAEVILEFLDALGVANCVAFGDSAGAAVLARAAATDPRRFSAISLAGIADYEKNWAPFPGFLPEWDGSHFARLWAFLREESCFAPWNCRTLGNRIFEAIPDTEELHHRLVQVISSKAQGCGYGELANHWNPESLNAELAQLSLPLLIVATHAEQNRAFPRELTGPSKVFESRAAALTEAILFIAQRLPPNTMPSPPTTRSIDGQLASRMVDVQGGQLHVRYNIDAGTIPLLVQHDEASSTGTVEPIARSLIGRRSVLAFDMPGSGQSDDLIDSDHANLQDYAESLAAALDEMGLEQVDFYGMWGGGFVGSELSYLQRNRVRRLVMSNLFFHEGE